MTWLLSILAFVVIFSLLILIHEAGHFFAAKKAGVKVEEFGMGMPPRIWGYRPKKSETLYSINAIPFGGFVRLYGEDSHDTKLLKNPHSFASKSAGKKIMIIVAGVVMNFLLAFVLLLVGFLVGMQPLLVTPEDVYNGIDSGVIKLQQGLIVKEVGENNIGFLPGDKVLMVNDKKIVLGDELSNLKDKELVSFQVERAGSIIDLKGEYISSKPFFKPYDLLPLSRVVVGDLDKQGNLYRAGLRPGDLVEMLNGKQIFAYDQLLEEFLNSKSHNFQVNRNGKTVQIVLPSQVQPQFIISEVLADSNADKAGLIAGDKILAINDKPITTDEDLSQSLNDKSSEKVTYRIMRDISQIDYYVKRNEAGLTGIFISPVYSLENQKINFYVKSVPYSILKIENVQYSLLEAPGKALEEMGRLSVMTAGMFVNVLGRIFTTFSVPEGVAGPVGIAQMTFVFVQEGIVSLIRFTALLSLSLGVINILPFPGLDGGRLILIVIPLLIGKKLNPKTEALIHVIGFLVLMLLILLITMNDITRLF